MLRPKFARTVMQSPTLLRRVQVALLAVILLLGLLTTGCGGPRYAFRVGKIESKIETAKEMGAEQLAPYYYYGARERVIKAREEAGRADYNDALDLLDEADDLVEKAISRAGAVKKGAGR